MLVPPHAVRSPRPKVPADTRRLVDDRRRPGGYAPSMTAFGIVFIALGAVTKWPLSVIGAVIFVFAIAKWIGELLHD